MSKVVSLRLREEQVKRLGKVARRLGRSPSETAALLLEEALRENEFALIQFRDSPVGRQAYIQGTGLAVWEVALVAQAFENDPGQTAAHLELPLLKVQAALGYADAYPEEIAEALADNERSVADLARLLPSIEEVTIDAPEHLPPALTTQLSCHGIDAVALRDWQSGQFFQRPDHEILAAAQLDGRTIVTYDRRTFPLLLRNWAEEGRSHAGIIFVDNRSIAPNDVGGLLRALVEVEKRFADESWQDCTVFLNRSA